MNRRKRKKHLTAYAFILPDFIGLLLFVILPILYAFWISFYKWDFISDKVFVGFSNYQKMFRDKDWWDSLGRTVKLTLMYVPSLFVISLFLATVVSYIKSRAGSFIKTSFLMPFAITSVIASTLWMFLFNEKRGYLNALLNLVGIPDQQYIGSDSQAMGSIVLVLLWINIGYNMVLFLSAIKDIPPSYQEAATLDGASKWQIFRYLTFASFQVLDLIMVMTKGGPAKATEVAALYIYNKSFQMMDMGYGSALSVVLFLILAVFSAIQLKLTGKEEKR